MEQAFFKWDSWDPVDDEGGSSFSGCTLVADIAGTHLKKNDSIELITWLPAQSKVVFENEEDGKSVEFEMGMEVNLIPLNPTTNKKRKVDDKKRKVDDNNDSDDDDDDGEVAEGETRDGDDE